MQGALAGSVASASCTPARRIAICRSPIASTNCSGGSGMRARRALGEGTETERDRVPKKACVGNAGAELPSRPTRTRLVLTA